MVITPARIFTESDSVGNFRDALINLDGNFPFTKEDMIELGDEYLKKYPDTFSDRNTEEIRIGYQIVRVCIVEIMVSAIGREYRNSFRGLFFDISLIKSSVSNLFRERGIDTLNEIYMSLHGALNKVQVEIDLLPKGMIKERFIGGVTNIHNIMYLLKTSVAGYMKQ